MNINDKMEENNLGLKLSPTSLHDKISVVNKCIYLYMDTDNNSFSTIVVTNYDSWPL